MSKSAGRHLVLDGFVRDPSVFTADRLSLLFQNLADALKMKILQGPTFLEVPIDEAKLQSEEFEDEGGITGSCIISTSHIALHAWPLRNYLSLDVFSCKEFDVGTAMVVIHDHLGLEHVNVINLTRMVPVGVPSAPKAKVVV